MRIRRQGWALVDQELEDGLRAIAAPIHDEHGNVIAAANLAVHASRWSNDAIRNTLLPRLLTTTTAIDRDTNAAAPPVGDGRMRQGRRAGRRAGGRSSRSRDGFRAVAAARPGGDPCLRRRQPDADAERCGPLDRPCPRGRAPLPAHPRRSRLHPRRRPPVPAQPPGARARPALPLEPHPARDRACRTCGT